MGTTSFTRYSFKDVLKDLKTLLQLQRCVYSVVETSRVLKDLRSESPVFDCVLFLTLTRKIRSFKRSDLPITITVSISGLLRAAQA